VEPSGGGVVVVVVVVVAEEETHPGGAVELGQQEEHVLLSRVQGFVLTAAVAVLRAHHVAGRELPEARHDEGLPLVQLGKLPRAQLP